MVENTDDTFFARADEHIHLSNKQLQDASSGKVSASMMYATARFNAWVSASSVSDRDELVAARSEAIEYFVAEYQKVLEENLDEYIENFDRYMELTRDGEA